MSQWLFQIIPVLELIHSPYVVNYEFFCKFNFFLFFQIRRAKKGLSDKEINALLDDQDSDGSVTDIEEDKVEEDGAV